MKHRLGTLIEGKPLGFNEAIRGEIIEAHITRDGTLYLTDVDNGLIPEESITKVFYQAKKPSARKSKDQLAK